MDIYTLSVLSIDQVGFLHSISVTLNLLFFASFESFSLKNLTAQILRLLIQFFLLVEDLSIDGD